jgi:transposase-like protein
MSENGSSSAAEMVSGTLGKRAAEARWRRLIEDQRVSGLPVSVFCRERGIPQSSLFAWRRRLAARADSPRAAPFKAVTITPASSMMVPADADSASPVVSSVELLLPGDRRLLLRRGFDPQLLLDLIDVLESQR